MIQDILPHVYNNSFKNKELSENDLYICFKNNQLLCRKEDDLVILPSVKNDGIRKAVYLFSIDETGFYLCDEEIEGYNYLHQNEIRTIGQQWLKFGIITAMSLARWYNNNKYCGKCGSMTIPDGKERMLKCPDCGNMIYPKICPVAIVGVINGDKILLTKYADRTHYAKYALVAGFTEIGETIEQTVKREVKEETGLEVTNINYYGSQPWSFSDSLIFGFFCEVEGNDKVSLDDHELGVAVWANQDEVMVDENDNVSITHQLMREFRKHGRKVLDFNWK